MSKEKNHFEYMIFGAGVNLLLLLSLFRFRSFESGTGTAKANGHGHEEERGNGARPIPQRYNLMPQKFNHSCAQVTVKLSLLCSRFEGAALTNPSAVDIVNASA